MNANAHLYVPVYNDSYVEKIECDFRAARVMAVRTAYSLPVEELFFGGIVSEYYSFKFLKSWFKLGLESFRLSETFR